MKFNRIIALTILNIACVHAIFGFGDDKKVKSESTKANEDAPKSTDVEKQKETAEEQVKKNEKPLASKEVDCRFDPSQGFAATNIAVLCNSALPL